MITTNVHNLPAPVAAALAHSDYTRGESDISITGLISPPQLAALYEQHKDEVVEDVSELFWRVWGTALHDRYARFADESLVAEERLYMECQGWVVSGQPDLRGDGILVDHKTTSAWTVVYEPTGRRDWHEQLNGYAHLCRANGYPVTKALVWASLRDWQRNQAANGGKYPPIPFVEIEIPLWSPEETEAWLSRRVLLHQAAREEGRWEDCTDEERWRNEKTGKYTRCEGYCPVSTWCPTLQREAGLLMLATGTEPVEIAEKEKVEL